MRSASRRRARHALIGAVAVDAVVRKESVRQSKWSSTLASPSSRAALDAGQDLVIDGTTRS